MTAFAAVCLSIAGVSLPLSLYLWRSLRRCHAYAVAQSEQYDAFDPVGWAYSDMATVITLDGKAEPRPHISPFADPRVSPTEKT